jgi:hypothetical protein
LSSSHCVIYHSQNSILLSGPSSFRFARVLECNFPPHTF